MMIMIVVIKNKNLLELASIKWTKKQHDDYDVYDYYFLVG